MKLKNEKLTVLEHKQMSKKNKLAIAKAIVFSTIAIIACAVLKADKYPNIIAIPAGIGIAVVTLAVSEQQGGIEVDE